MALNTLNTGAISFKKLSGKAHTQQGFAVTEEGISSNIQISYSTIFASRIESLPVTNSGLTTLYSTNGKVQRIKFQVDLIPNTQIGVNQSQGYQLKLPADWNTHPGALYPAFSAGTYLNSALGKLQIVPTLYGKLKIDGSTEYDPILYQTNGSTVITKFDPINWYLDPYNGVLFIQDPPAGYDISASRPGYVEAFLYVGNYLDYALAHISGGTGSTGGGTLTGATNGLIVRGKNVTLGGTLTGDTTIARTGSTLNLGDYNNGETAIQIFDGGILITETGNAPDNNSINLTSYHGGSLITNTNHINMNFRDSAVFGDLSPNHYGLQYADDYSTGFTKYSLVDKNYVTGLTSGGGGTITGATNGLSVSGKNIKLGGVLTGNTTIAMSTHKFVMTGGTWNFTLDPVNNRLIAGSNCQVTGGTINYTFGDTNINAGNFGSVTFGELSEITANGGDSMVCGEGSYVDAYGGKSFARSGAVRANGSYAFIGGAFDDFAYGKTNLKSPQVNAYAAFGFYITDGNQVDNHGVNATASAILGGLNHNIPATSDYSAIIGGNTIKAATGVTNTVYLPKVRIGQGIGAGLVTNNTNNDIVVRNSATGELEIRDAVTLISGMTSGGSQNIYITKRIVTGSTTLLTTDFVIFVNGTTALALTLPLAPNDGEVLKIKDVSGNASTNNITINGNGKNIDGSSTITINTDRGGVELCFDTTLNYWSIMNFVG